MTITVYTFEDADGNPFNETWSTQDHVEAREYGQLHGLRVIANEYEFVDRDLAWDFTPQEEETHP
jgi:hypothetical protein